MNNRIRELRLKKGLKVKEIVGLLGISRGHYNHLENGTRSFTDDLAKEAAHILNVKADKIKEISNELAERNAPPNSWIFKIQIDSKPFIKAFLEFYSEQKEKSNIEDMVTKFITSRIEHSVREELRNNSEISEYILTRISR